MSEYLGSIYSSGDPAPEKGTYQLLNDDPNVDPRTDRSRVIRLDQGDAIPPHPDTSASTQWRFVRLDEAHRGEPMHTEF